MALFGFAGKKYTDLDEFGPGELDQPASTFVNVVASSNPFSKGPCRGILCDVAGTIDIIQIDGTQVAGVPVQPGWNRFVIGGITALHTVANVKAIY